MKTSYIFLLFLGIIPFVSAQEQERLSVITAKNQAISHGETDQLSAFFDEKAIIGNPEKRIAKGLDNIITHYKDKTSETYTIHTLTEYINFENYMIVKERITDAQGSSERLAIYRFKKDKIKNMWILTPTFHPTSPLVSVNQLVQGLLNSDLELFMGAVSSGIEECDFPGNCHVSGRVAMRKRSETYLGKQQTKYKLVKRMVLGNIVIDDNYLSILTSTSGERNISIYTTDVQGKIERIEFIGF